MRRDRSSGGKWQMADGLWGRCSPLSGTSPTGPRPQNGNQRCDDVLRRCSDRGRGGRVHRWGHSSPSAPSEATGEQVVELSRAPGQKGLPVSLRVMQALAASSPPNQSPLNQSPQGKPSSSQPRRHHSAECGMPFGWWFANRRLFFPPLFGRAVFLGPFCFFSGGP
jgi:hypothetical protein